MYERRASVYERRASFQALKAVRARASVRAQGQCLRAQGKCLGAQGRPYEPGAPGQVSMLYHRRKCLCYITAMCCNLEHPERERERERERDASVYAISQLCAATWSIRREIRRQCLWHLEHKQRDLWRLEHTETVHCPLSLFLSLSRPLSLTKSSSLSFFGGATSRQKMYVLAPESICKLLYRR